MTELKEMRDVLSAHFSYVDIYVVKLHFDVRI